MSATQVGQLAALDSAFGDLHGDSWPDIWYVALFLDDPGESGSGTEVSGSGYERAEVANDDGNWDTLGSNSKANAAQITFPGATGGWGEVTHWALFDDAIAGDAYFYGTVATPETVISGDVPFVGVNELVVTVD